MSADSGLVSNYVRNWVHYDNLASSFYKQSMGARKVRDEYETKIIEYLRQMRMENAIIQTNNGRISMYDEKKPNQLSLIKIRELLHAFYRSKGGKDETTDIMTFISGNRGYEMKTCLRKSNFPVQATPPPPPPPQLM